MIAIFTSAMDSWAAKLVILIAVGRPDLLRDCGPDQRLAHLVRVLARPWYPGLAAVPQAQPRQGAAVRGGRSVVLLAADHDPGAVGAMPRAWPGRSQRSPGSAQSGSTSPTSSRCICGYRAGDAFETGPWTLGRRYRLVNILAMIFVVVVVITLSLPFTHASVPWNDDFDITTVNYSPLVLVLGTGRRDLVGGVGEEQVHRPRPHPRGGRGHTATDRRAARQQARG